MEKNTPTIMGLASLIFGALLLIVSVAGVFWPATPITDPGMLSTSAVFLLFGVLGIVLGKQTAKTA
jgi:hypothetical protein